MSGTGISPEQLALHEIKDKLAALPEDDRIRVQSIAWTLRNILSMEPVRAPLAFWLIAAEEAAKTT